MYVLHCSFAVDLHDGVTDIELLIVSVTPPKSLNFLFYRPASANVVSLDHLSRTLYTLNPSSFNKIILLGDFNVNYFLY